MTPSKKPDLKVEYAPIRSVKPAKGNTRVHPPEQINEVARSIEAFGWTKPIIVDEHNEILAGHGADRQEGAPRAAEPAGERIPGHIGRMR